MSAYFARRRARVEQLIAKAASVLLDSPYAVRYFFAVVTFLYFWGMGQVADGIVSLHGAYLLIGGYAVITGCLHAYGTQRALPEWAGRSLALLDAPLIGLIVAHDPNPEVPLQLLWLIGALDHGMRYGLHGYLVAGVSFVLAACFVFVLRLAHVAEPVEGSALWLLFLGVAGYLYGLRLIAERDRADSRADDAQRSIAVTVESIGLGIWRYDYETGRLDWDANTHRLAGLTPGHFSGRFGDFLRMLKTSDAEQLLRSTAESLASGKPWEQEYEVLWADGSEHLISARGIVARDAEGVPLEMFGVCWDITHMRRDYRTMIEASTRAAAAAAVAGIGYWSLQLSGNRIHADAQVLKFFGLPPEPATYSYEHFVQRLAENNQQGVAAALRRTMDHGLPLQTEFRACHATGQERTVRAIGYAVRMPGQSGPGQIIGAAMDVTRERRDQQQLRSAVERLHNFSEATRIGCWRHELADTCMRIDERLAAMLGLAPGTDRCAAERLLQCVHPDDRDRALDYFRSLPATDGTTTLEQRSVWPDGSVHWMLLHGAVERDEAGVATATYGVAMDVSRLDSAMAEQEQTR